MNNELIEVNKVRRLLDCVLQKAQLDASVWGEQSASEITETQLAEERVISAHEAIAALDRIEAALSQQEAEPVADTAWSLAQKVRADMDRRACPDVFMKMAFESIEKHYPSHTEPVGVIGVVPHFVENVGRVEDRVCVNFYSGKAGTLADGDLVYASPPKPAALPQPVASSQEIDRLTKCLAKANERAEHFEREWYLRGDIIEQLRDAEQWHEEEKEKLAQWMISRSIATGHGDTISDLIAALESHDPVASSQDVEEFIAAHDYDQEDMCSGCVPSSALRAWMAGHARVPVEFMKSLHCPNLNCMEGVLYLKGGDIEQCQWCYEFAMLTASKERTE